MHRAGHILHIVKMPGQIFRCAVVIQIRRIQFTRIARRVHLAVKIIGTAGMPGIREPLFPAGCRKIKGHASKHVAHGGKCGVVAAVGVGVARKILQALQQIGIQPLGGLQMLIADGIQHKHNDVLLRGHLELIFTAHLLFAAHGGVRCECQRYNGHQLNGAQKRRYGHAQGVPLLFQKQAQGHRCGQDHQPHRRVHRRVSAQCVPAHGAAVGFAELGVEKHILRIGGHAEAQHQSACRAKCPPRHQGQHRAAQKPRQHGSAQKRQHKITQTKTEFGCIAEINFQRPQNAIRDHRQQHRQKSVFESLFIIHTVPPDRKSYFYKQGIPFRGAKAAQMLCSAYKNYF